ncbi:hypothetical protein PpBr36_07167 [Pyricularia pennisetigena]|uniref:hypothetical protein n=1 Tax=Pyricularia pennisetigena TaxID=1578925 RepID=UPI0011504307|nr:hypothetical protein PpBr36_07167 [Pyricularia pennisetigena]TLS25233.1 hypothetical protein PpBr36_07167 [Pyricularia pennisetigena]
MKILEAQNAVLTNYEVYIHLIESETRFSSRHKKEHRRPPKNYQAVTKDVANYCRTYPNPLSQKPLTYTKDSLAQLLGRLAEFGLAKGEVLMLANLRPTELPGLHVCIEEIAERFTEEQQTQILEAVVEVLGAFPASEEQAEEYGDEEVTDSIENGNAS